MLSQKKQTHLFCLIVLLLSTALFEPSQVVSAPRDTEGKQVESGEAKDKNLKLKAESSGLPASAPLSDIDLKNVPSLKIPHSLVPQQDERAIYLVDTTDQHIVRVFPRSDTLSPESLASADALIPAIEQYLSTQTYFPELKKIRVLNANESSPLFTFLADVEEQYLKLRVKKVAVGTPYTQISLEGTWNGVPIRNSLVTLTLLQTSGNIVSLASNVTHYLEDARQSTVQPLDIIQENLKQALIAKAYQGIEQKIEFLSAEKVYFPVPDKPGTIRLGYVFQIWLKEPFGIFQIVLDASDGNVVDVTNITLTNGNDIWHMTNGISETAYAQEETTSVEQNNELPPASQIPSFIPALEDENSATEEVTTDEVMPPKVLQPGETYIPAEGISVFEDSSKSNVESPVDAETSPGKQESETDANSNDNMNSVVNIIPAENDPSSLLTADHLPLTSPLSQTVLSGRIILDGDLSAGSIQPLKEIRVTVAGQAEPVFTDSLGGINVDAGNVQQVELASQQFEIQDDQQGGVPSLTQAQNAGAASGSGSVLSLTNSNLVNSLSSGLLPVWDTNAYYYVQKGFAWAQRNLGLDLGQGYIVHTNSRLLNNADQKCLAVALPMLKKIEIGSGGCISNHNLALSGDLVLHEVAHLILEEQSSVEWNTDTALLREGIVDFFAADLNDNGIVGEQVSVSRDLSVGPVVRTGDAHLDSLLLSGALWEIRNSSPEKERLLPLVFATWASGTTSLEEFAYTLGVLSLPGSGTETGQQPALRSVSEGGSTVDSRLSTVSAKEGRPSDGSDLPLTAYHLSLVLDTFAKHGVGVGSAGWNNMGKLQIKVPLEQKWWKKDTERKTRLNEMLGEDSGQKSVVSGQLDTGNGKKSGLVEKNGQFEFGDSSEQSTVDGRMSTVDSQAAGDGNKLSPESQTVADQNPQAVALLMADLADRQRIRTVMNPDFKDGFTFALKTDETTFTPQFLQNESLSAVDDAGTLIYSGTNTDILYSYDPDNRMLKEVIAVEQDPTRLLSTVVSRQLGTGSGTLVDSTLSGSGSLLTSSLLPLPSLPDYAASNGKSTDLKFSWTVSRGNSKLVKDPTDKSVWLVDAEGNNILKIDAPYYTNALGETQTNNIYWVLNNDEQLQETLLGSTHILTLMIRNPKPDEFPLLIDPTIFNNWSFVDQVMTGGLNYNTAQSGNNIQFASFNNALYATWHETCKTGATLCTPARYQIRVKKYDGASWTWVDGGADNGINYDPTQHGYYPSLVVFNNGLYASWQEACKTGATLCTPGKYQIRVKKYDGSSWTWADGGTDKGINYVTTENAQIPQGVVFNNKLYLIWSERVSSALYDNIRVKVYDGTSWSAADPGGANGINYDTTKTAYNPRLAVHAGLLYATWDELYTGTNTRQIRVKKYDNNAPTNSWTSVDGNAVTGINVVAGSGKHAFAPYLIEFNSVLYNIWYEYTGSVYLIRVRKYNDDGATWTTVDGGSGLNYSSSQSAQNPPQATVFNNNLYVTWVEYVGVVSQTRVKKYDGSTWSFVDGNVNKGINYDTTKNATLATLAVYNNSLYAGWQEVNTTFKIRVKKFDGDSWYFVDSPITQSNTGPLTFSSCESDASNGGTKTWTNPSDAQGSANGINAYSLSMGPETSEYLKCTGYYSSIPATASITGISVTVRRYASGAQVKDSEVHLVKGGTILSDDRADPANWSSPGPGYEDKVYGSASDLWGTTWTPSDFNSTFGVALSARNTSLLNRTPYVDNISVTISYNENMMNGLNKDTTQHATLPQLSIFNNELYATWAEEDASAVTQIRVRKYDATRWTWADGGGAAGLNVDPAKNATASEFAVYNNELYLTWSEATTLSTKVYVKKYNGSTWASVDSGGFGGGSVGGGGAGESPQITPYGSHLYLTYIQTKNLIPFTRQVYIFRYDGSTWTQVDDGTDFMFNYLSHHAYMPQLTVYGSDLYATWLENDGNNEIRMRKFNGTVWTDVDDGGLDYVLNYATGQEALNPQLAVVGSDLYMTWAETDISLISQIRVRKYNGTTWTWADGGEDTGINYETGQNAVNPALVGFQDNLFVSWSEADSQGIAQIRIKKYDGTAWYAASNAADEGGVQDTGWLNFSDCVSDPSNGGAKIWAKPSFALDSDDSSTTVDFTPVTSTSEYLACSNPIGVSIPPNATIQGIEVQIEKSMLLGFGDLVDDTVSLVKNGAVVGDNYAIAGAWPATDTYVAYGGAADLWGSPWKPSHFNSTFGVVLSAAGDFRTATVDHMQVRVTYVDSPTQSLNYDTTKDATTPYLAVYGNFLYGTWVEMGGSAGKSNQIRVSKYDGLTWNESGNSGLNYDAVEHGVFPQILEYNGALYATWEEPCTASATLCSPGVIQIRVKKYINGSWTFVDTGTDAGMNSDPSKETSSPALALYNNELYLSWSEETDFGNGPAVHVQHYNGSSWTDEGAISALGLTSIDPKMVSFSNKLYITWTSWLTGCLACKYKIYVYEFDGTTWSDLSFGGAGLNYAAKDGGSPDVMAYNGKVYFTWSEMEGVTFSDQIRVRAYDGSSWTWEDGGAATGINYNTSLNAGNSRLATYGTKLYVTWQEYYAGIYQIRVKSYDGSTWTFEDGNASTGINKDPGENANSPVILASGNYLYASWHETNSAKTYIRIKRYDGSAWTFIDGDDKFGINNDQTKSAYYPALGTYGTQLYAIWSEASAAGDQIVYKIFDSESYISLSITSGSDINFGTISSGTLYNNFSSTFAIQTNSKSGYQILVNDQNTGNSALEYGANAVPDFPTLLPSSALWTTEEGLGVCVYSATGKDTTMWGTGTSATDGNNKYAGIKAKEIMIHTKTGYSAQADSVSVGYGLKVGASQAAGTYTGIITYSVVPNL